MDSRVWWWVFNSAMWMNIISVISTHLLKKLKAMHMTQLGGFRVMIICLFIYVKWHQPIPLGCHIFMTFLHQAKLSLLKKRLRCLILLSLTILSKFFIFSYKKIWWNTESMHISGKDIWTELKCTHEKGKCFDFKLKKKKNDSLLTMRSLQMKKSCFILNFHT